MKKLLMVFFFVVLALHNYNAKAQLFKKVKNLIESPQGLTENDAANGIIEALIKGTEEAVNLTSKTDGYFGNPEIKIPFPPDAREIDSKLRSIGLGNKVDEVILTLNRAAEDAANEANPIFISAIKSLSIQDALSIVKGEKDAATRYLEKTTSDQLTEKFRPVIQNSLDKVDATKHWTEVINTYNKIPFVKKMNPDLAEYVTEQALEGLFIMVAKEEYKIRTDPVARTSELLRIVFGNK
ncbi:MAG: DUF4197 domain-containing protein [Bacteroidales bacterium]|nr:DUF4197 domain-containing protein [Bacteroidales bacterium]